jgi:flagellar biosynthetic protein FliR
MGLGDLMRFVLVLVRVGGVMVFLPVLGNRTTPVYAKIGFVVALSVVLFPVVRPDLPAVEWRPVPLLMVCLAEMLLGMLAGMTASIIFSSVRISGEMVGRQTGMALAVSADPLGGVRVTVVGNFCHAVAILTFLSINGHHHMLQALHESFRLWPLGTFLSADLALRASVASAVHCFRIAFQLAAPLLVVTFVLSLVMALMARLAKEMNVMIFGFALRLLVGLLGLTLFTPVLVHYAGEVTRLAASFVAGVLQGG